MTEFEEVRPLEGMYAPLVVRRELRQMFERWLPRLRQPHPIAEQNNWVVDELDLLDLCQHYRLEYPGNAEDVAETWDESEERLADGGPTFNDLARLGWVLFDGGRWTMQKPPRGTSPHITYPSPSTKIFLTGLAKAQLVAKTGMPSANAQTLAKKILAENWLDQRIPIKDPHWLAGRLWERLCPKPKSCTAGNGSTMQTATSAVDEGSESLAVQEEDAAAIDRAFLEWSAWCDALGGVTAWDNGWGAVETRHCREAAHRVLERQTLWGTWNSDIANYTNVLEKTFAIPRDQLRYAGIPRTAPPQTLVSRADWLKWPEVEHLIMEQLSSSTVSFAFNLLCSELEKTDIGPSIPAAAEALLLFAANHPIALQLLLFQVNAVPAMLVDMLMHQRIAGLATKLTIEWRPSQVRHSDRTMIREAQTKAFAVQDSLSLLAYHLHKGTLDLEEYASLITWCYDGGAGRRMAAADSRRRVGRQLLEMIAKAKEELQSSVLQHLVDEATYENNVPRARFAGVLDGLNRLSNARSAIASPVVTLYSKFARDMHLEWTDVSSLSAELAARLIAIAFMQAPPDRDALLFPFDSVKLLRETSDDERPTLRSSIAQTLRGHVRFLARAVAGWPDDAVPLELYEALLTLIPRSVIEHAEKGRVGALTDRYSPSRFFAREDGSPAQDLTAAWRRLDSNKKKAMLQALAQSDDPVLLADLCQHLPAAARPDIQARLRQLKPGDASTFWTWIELQHRIESLLAAGEYELAREHLDDSSRDIDRAPSQFRLGLFGVELQLLLKERNWASLDVAIVPATLDQATTRQAQDLLDFYKATSQLLRPNGDLAGARVVLQQLAARPGAASAYKENAFAAAIQQLLGPTLLPLSSIDKVTGESLLAEINTSLAMDEKLASSSLLANRGLLLLALQRPDEALRSFAERRQETRSPELELIAVLAKQELGLREEAMAILDAAITEFGTVDLAALKNDLQAGEATPSIASASVIVDSMTSIRAALQQLNELPPSQVGEILGPVGRGLRGYLTRQVSRAVASLQHMAAMLRDRKNPADEARFEDDLNTAVREVLRASLAVTKWNVADQSLGGATVNGNPGERDAVIEAFGQEISIYEALVCSGLDRTNIKRHFDKLLSYGTCDIYFHVIYSYAQEIKSLFEYVEKMLEYEVPDGLTYLDCKFLTPSDFETSGYIATYRVDHREIAVVFLIADLKVSRSKGSDAAVLEI